MSATDNRHGVWRWRYPRAVVAGTRRFRLLLPALATAIGTVAVSVALAGPRVDAGAGPRVTVIGDSVMTAVEWHPPAFAVLSNGLDLRLEVAICRRLAVLSCPHDGQRAPTAVELIDSLGAEIGQLAVVVAGYNEPEEQFADDVQAVLDALTRAGVARILWATLSEADPSLGRMNDTLRASHNAGRTSL